jgi:methionine-rich copper-binding protein CopC
VKRPAHASAALAGAFAVALACAPHAVRAHAVLRGSDPPADSVVTASPKQLRLDFNEPLEPVFTSAKVAGPGGREIVTDKAQVDNADARTVRLSLPPLAAGSYKARWSATGRDGHRVKGEFGFTVKP